MRQISGSLNLIVDEKNTINYEFWILIFLAADEAWMIITAVVYWRRPPPV